VSHTDLPFRVIKVLARALFFLKPFVLTRRCIHGIIPLVVAVAAALFRMRIVRFHMAVTAVKLGMDYVQLQTGDAMVECSLAPARMTG